MTVGSGKMIWILVANWSSVESSESNACDVTREIGPLYFNKPAYTASLYYKGSNSNWKMRRKKFQTTPLNRQNSKSIYWPEPILFDMKYPLHWLIWIEGKLDQYKCFFKTPNFNMYEKHWTQIILTAAIASWRLWGSNSNLPCMMLQWYIRIHNGPTHLQDHISRFSVV